MARRATIIKGVRGENEGTVLVLDAGDSLLGQPVSLATEGAALVDLMNVMGYDAMTVGRLDLSKGVEALQLRAKEANFPLLSANVVKKGTRELLFAADTVIERDGVRYGILGVTETEAALSVGGMDVIDVLDPVETVRAALPDLQARSDVVIVLSHLGFDQDQALAEAVEGIDIIIGGRTRNLIQEPEIVGGTIITQMGYDGEYLGRLDVTVSDDGTVSDPSADIIALTPEIADDPEVAGMVLRYKSEYPEPTPVTS